MMTVKEWLESDACKCFDVRPVRVTIGAETFTGCEYRQKGTAPEGSRVALEGRPECEIHALYLLADRLPKCLRKPNARAALVWEGSPWEWYLGGHSIELLESKSAWARHWKKEAAANQFHHDRQPCGYFFRLSPWDVPDGSLIDRYEDEPYSRVPMTVEYLTV